MTLQLPSILQSFIVLFTEGHRFPVFIDAFVAADPTVNTVEASAVLVSVIIV